MAVSELPAGLRYWVFISYSQQDRAWAEWLQRELERFKVPSALRRDPAAAAEGTFPTRIFPVFRDRSELAASGELGAVLNAALEQSLHLVVVCSPAAARSHWVNEEIEVFRRAGRPQNLHALIVDGEPGGGEQECFPPALRAGSVVGRSDTTTGSGGEPIAADVRDHRDGRRDALLKVVAPILGVGFDALKRRDHQRRVRTLVLVAGVMTAIAALLAGLALFALQQRGVARNNEARAVANEAAASAAAAREQRARVAAEASDRQARDAAHEALLARDAADAAAREEARARAQAEAQRKVAETSLAGMVAAQADVRFSRGLDNAAHAVLAAAHAWRLGRDARSEAVLRKLLAQSGGAVLQGLPGGITGLAFSNDERWLVSVSTHGALQQWDLAHPERPGTLLRNDILGGKASISGADLLLGDGVMPQVAISGDGARIAVASGDRMLVLPREAPGDVRWLSPAIGTLHSVLWSPRDGTLIAASVDGRFAVWPQGRIDAEPLRHARPIEGSYAHAALDPDGLWFAHTGDAGLFLYEIDKPSSPRRLACGNDHPIRVGFSADGDLIVGIGTIDLERSELCAWSRRDLERRPLTEIVAVALPTGLAVPGPLVMVLGLDGRIPVWPCFETQLCGRSTPMLVLQRDFVTKACPADRVDACDLWLTLAMSPGGRWLAAGGANGRIRLFPMSGLDREPRVLPDRDFFARGLLDPRVDEWKPWSGPRPGPPDGSEVTTLALSPDGETVRWLDRDGGLGRWSLQDRNQREAERTLLLPDRRTSGGIEVVAAPLAGRLVGYDRSGRIVGWQIDAAAPRSLPSWPAEPARGPLALAASADGRRVAWAMRGQALREVEIDTGRRREWPQPALATGSPVSLVYGAGGTRLWLLVHDADGRSTIIEQTLGTLTGASTVVGRSDQPLKAIAASPDGRWLAARVGVSDVLLWARGRPVGSGRILRYAGSGDMHFVGGGRMLAVGGSGATLWSVDRAEPVRRLSLPETLFSSALQVAPDGRWVAAGTRDGNVVLWRLDPESLVDLACTMAGRDLDADEWRSYFGALAHPPLCARHDDATRR